MASSGNYEFQEKQQAAPHEKTFISIFWRTASQSRETCRILSKIFDNFSFSIIRAFFPSVNA